MAAVSDSRPSLPEPLEAELAAIAADPGESVGLGLKADVPYEPNVAHYLISYEEPAVTVRLAGEVANADDGVDPVLLATLEKPELRATSAYLLGCADSRAYPKRTRDLTAIRAALRRHLDDDGTFSDPFYQRDFRVQDFVLGAFIRLSGAERFRFPQPHTASLIGCALPDFDAATRADLLAQVATA